MNIIAEKFTENYPIEILSSIWNEAAQKSEEYGRRRIAWAFDSNPFGKARLWLLRDGSTQHYFGCSALLPRNFILKGVTVQAGLIADTAIKKEYRTLGPALFLHQEIIRNSNDLAFMLAFPNKIAEAVIQRVGFKKAKSVGHWVKIIKSGQAIKKKIKSPLLSKLLLLFAPILDLGFLIFDFRPDLKKRFICKEESDFHAQFDSAWNKFKSTYDFILDRNVEYLRWRYKNNPNLERKYKIFSICDRATDELAGYVVYFIENGLAHATDFLWVEEKL